MPNDRLKEEAMFEKRKVNVEMTVASDATALLALDTVQLGGRS